METNTHTLTPDPLHQSGAHRHRHAIAEGPASVEAHDMHTVTTTLTPDLRDKMDAYWRAANYLSVGQIYLYDNPLLKRPLALADVKAHAARPLGHNSGAELHLHAPQPGHQEVRPRHDLRLRSRARRPGGRGQHLPGRHLQRGLSEHQSGRGRAAEALHPVLVSRRNSQPCFARNSGFDPRGRRAGLFAQPFLRRGLR